METELTEKWRHGLSCLSEKPALAECPLLSAPQVAELASVFETLSNETRLRLLHAIVRAGEASPSELATKISMKPQAVCNQLQRLADRGIVESRRNGNNVLYRIVDPCVIDLLERGLWLLEDIKARHENGG
ncbi:metalloregulator ArsR/SmtB family transcription factor [soil metagenome]